MNDNVKTTCENNCLEAAFGATGGVRTVVVVFARTLLMAVMIGKSDP